MHRIRNAGRRRWQVAAFAAMAGFCALAAQAQVEVPVAKVEYSSPPGAGYCLDTKCWVTRGKTALVKVQASGITMATHVTDSSQGLSTSLTGWKQVGTPGRIEVQLQVGASTDRGNKTVRLQQKASNGTVMTEWKFDVYVIHNGSISSVDMPPKSAFYTEAEVTVNGSDLGNAGLTLFEHDLRTTKPTVTKLSNSSSQVRFKLNWGALQSAPTFGVRLCDEALPAQISCFPVAGQPMWGEVKGAVQGPPAVVGLTVGPITPQAGTTMTIRFTLWGAAPSGGATVWWRLTPAADFQSEPGSCAYNNQGQMNQTTVPSGATYRECKVRVVANAGSGNRTLESWTVDNTRSEAPYRRTHNFSVSPSAGTTSTASLQGIISGSLYVLGTGTTTDDLGNNYVPLAPFLNNPHCQGIGQPNPPYNANGHQRSNRVTISVPAIGWRVRNNGSVMVSNATARLVRGSQVLQSQGIANLAAGTTTSTFTYSRPNSSTCVARLGNDGGCYHCGTSTQGWNDNNVTIAFQ